MMKGVVIVVTEDKAFKFMRVFQLFRNLFRAEMCKCAEFQLLYHLTFLIPNLCLAS